MKRVIEFLDSGGLNLLKPREGRAAMVSDERLRFWERQLLPTNVTATFEAIAAEATAAYRARVRAQAIQVSPPNRAKPWRCGLCKSEWWSRDDERHIAAPDGQPCAAEVEP
jgi:hypothetical protein